MLTTEFAFERGVSSLPMSWSFSLSVICPCLEVEAVDISLSATLLEMLMTEVSFAWPWGVSSTSSSDRIWMTSLLVSAGGSSSTRSMMSEAAFALLAEFDKEERREAAEMSDTPGRDALTASATDFELTSGTGVVETLVKLTSFKDFATAADDEVMIMSDPRTVRELALELDGIKFTLSSWGLGLVVSLGIS